ncbi:hypothetical protein ACP4OV_015885 [Aristida adscensionis]
MAAREYTDVRREIYERLAETGNEEAVSGGTAFRDQLHRHFERLPASYSIDLDVERAEDVLLHKAILDECADPANRPVFHARFLKSIRFSGDWEDSCLEQNGNDGGNPTMRRGEETRCLHEIIFSSIDKPKVLSQLSALLSELGLNIREAHVFSTIDGFGLHVFVVDGWDTEETDGLLQSLKERAARNRVCRSPNALIQVRNFGENS